LTRIAIIVAIVGALVGIGVPIYFRKTKKDNEEVLGQLKEALKQQEEQRELLDKLKKEIEESKATQEKVLELENRFKKEFQDNFDTLFRFLSRIYRRSAENSLKKDHDIHQYFYYMQIFYRCLINIKTLNDYDLNRLNCTHKLLLEPEQKKLKTKLEKTDNICWYNVHLLKFINCCAKQNKLEYFAIAKLIYNDLFVLKIENFYDKFTEKINFDKLTEGIKVWMKDENRAEAEINETLELAKIYRDKSNPDPPI